MSIERKKDYFQFNKGLNTESSEINFPDGFTTDEANYDLLVDGSRRKRKALAQESGGSDLTTQTFTTSQRLNSFKWRAVGGDPTENQIAVQVGNRIYFMDDTDTPSATWNSQYVELPAAPNATTTNIKDTPVTFSSHRGFLFACSRYTEPCYIEYNAGDDDYTVTPFSLSHRDFYGIDDGVGIKTNPTVLSSHHKYNLANRGWKSVDIAQYNTDQSEYPNKSQVWWKGYVRQADQSTAASIVAEADGTHTWDSAKLAAERVGGSDAPQGSIVLNTFDTTVVEDGSLPVTTWTVVGGAGAGTNTVRLEFATDPGLGVSDTLVLTDFDAIYNNTGGAKLDWFRNIEYHTVTAVSGAGPYYVEFEKTFLNDGFVSWSNQYQRIGEASTSDPLVKNDGAAYDERPAVVEAHDGHLFYLGIPNSEYSDTIFFSQLAAKPIDFGKCYQKADPTDPDVNQLVATDGGTIVIPDLGNVKEAVSTRQGLLIFSDQGVWEIGNGRRGVFTADGYSVRKVTDAECTSPYSPIQVEDTVMFTGPKGIYVIGPNQYTGVLEANNVSEPVIQTLWNGITEAEKEKIYTAYDDARRQVHFLYDDGTNGNQYVADLILDLRVGAFFKYTFNSSSTDGILGAIAITDSDNAASNAKVKFFVQTSATALTVCDFNQTGYTDFDGAAMPTAYLYTGWDNLGDFQRRRSAPIITVYQQRTETGYTETGNGFDPVNESSTTMKGLWDWTDDAVTGKITAGQEVYRHVRPFVPSGTSDADGYPVVVTRNKLRGRGRVLQLYFEAGAAKDSHILGFTINYKIQRKI